jgi:predicted nuclease of predicted toxin-antitoxin system
MKFVLDMNHSPEWARVLESHGLEAVHWSEVGDPRASDAAILSWARDNERVVVTHDLDFGALLAASSSDRPSVIQIRSRDVMPQAMAPALVDALRRYENELELGALVVVDPARARVRILPLGDRSQLEADED